MELEGGGEGGENGGEVGDGAVEDCEPLKRVGEDKLVYDISVRGELTNGQGSEQSSNHPNQNDHRKSPALFFSAVVSLAHRRPLPQLQQPMIPHKLDKRRNRKPIKHFAGRSGPNGGGHGEYIVLVEEG